MKVGEALMAAEIAAQPEVVAGLVGRWEQVLATVQSVLPRELAGVAFVARGSSDNAALLGRYAVELYAGVPAVLAAPSLITRYQADLRYRDFLIVALSQSGATPEIVTVAEALRGERSRTLAITNDPSSPLATACDAALALGAGPERAVPATKTVTASMLMVLAVATAAARSRGRADGIGVDELTGLPTALTSVVADDGPAIRLADRWAGRQRLQVVGRGLSLGAVREIALKVKETAGVFADGVSSAELAHGPVSALDSAVPALLVGTGGVETAELDALAGRLRAGGVDVATCAPAPGSTLPLPAELAGSLRPLAAVVRGQQLAYAWARATGRDPDRPPGLTKVTATT